MRRRELITLLGGAAAAWPLAARAQQPMPVIGFLDPRSPDTIADLLRGFRQGLKDTGYIEGENVTVEYRWAENQYDRLPELAAALVRRQVAVIVTSGGAPVAFAAKAATSTIPIVFGIAADPVSVGLVASLARPGGNLTGVNFFSAELVAKRLELLRELVPTSSRVAVLVNPLGLSSEITLKDAEPAARALGCKSRSLKPVPARRSIRPSQSFCAIDPTLFSSAPTPSSPVGVLKWSNWRHVIRSPRHIPGVNIPK